MKRILPLLLALLLLAGCGGNEPVPSEEPSQTPDVVEPPAPEPEVTPEPEPEIEYELYTGEVPHIFTHCLIAYPEIKDGAGRMMYDPDCINVTEFKNLLRELYNNGYCLVDIHDVYETDAEGNLRLYLFLRSKMHQYFIRYPLLTDLQNPLNFR